MIASEVFPCRNLRAIGHLTLKQEKTWKGLRLYAFSSIGQNTIVIVVLKVRKQDDICRRNVAMICRSKVDLHNLQKGFAQRDL